MTSTRRLLRDLALPLWVTLGLFSIGIAPAWNAEHEASAAHHELHAANAALDLARRDLAGADQQGEEIRRDTQTLLALAKRGVIGEENQANREQFLAETSLRFHLTELRSEFGDRRPLDKIAPGEPGWFSTPLHFRLKSAHEEDLLHFLEALQQNAPALVHVRRCSLSPAQEADSTPRTESAPALLAADCDLDWLTLALTTR